MAKVRTKRYHDKPCRNCQKIFSPVTSWQMDCSPDCHDTFWKGKNVASKIVQVESRLAALESYVRERETISK